MSALADEIRSRGYWQVIIRPTAFVATRISDISALYPIVEKASVQLGGWDFPHIDPPESLTREVDWVGQETKWGNMLEIWRLHKSGQFFDLSGIEDDWRDLPNPWPTPENWRPGQRLGIGYTLSRYTEILEFAARLATTPAGDESMHVEVCVGGLAGRVLFVDDRGRAPLMSKPTAKINEFPFSRDISRAELIANPSDLALQAASELFKRFGWEGKIDVLRGFQSQLRRG